MAPAKPQVLTPSTIEELRRLSHAFLAGAATKLRPGECLWIVASAAGPLRRIQGVFDTEAEARKAIAEPVDRRLKWSKNEEERRVIYKLCPEKTQGGTTAPTQRTMSLDLVDPWQHLYTDVYEMTITGGSRSRRELADMVSVELKVNWNDDSSTTYTTVGACDAIFITSGAFDLFALPMYAAAYGVEYVDELNRMRRSRKRGSKA